MSDTAVKLRNLAALVFVITGPMFSADWDAGPLTAARALSVALALAWFFTAVWLMVLVAPSHKPPPR